jgi:DHA2 family multidrug resistance protein
MIFFVNFLPGTISAIVVGTMLKDPVKPEKVQMDWVGVGLLALGLGALQIVLDNGERRDWFEDGGIALTGIISFVALAAFSWWQWSGTKNPVVDLHVMKFRSVSVGSAIAFAFGALIFAPAIVTPLYSGSILNYNSFDSGLLLMMRALPVVLLTPVFATLAQKGADVRYMIGAGFALSAGSLWWLNTAMTSGSAFGTLAVPLFISGIGQSMLLVPLIVGVLTTTPPELNGKISPMITLFVQLGGSVASAASIAFFDRRTSFHSTVLAGASTPQHLSALGIAPTPGSIAGLAQLINQQASTMGFADTIAATAILAAVVVPIVLAFPRSKAMEGPIAE